MAAAAPALRENQIQWQWAQPGIEGGPADTHCSICRDPNGGSILAHRINAEREGANPLDIGHRVHQACLLKTHYSFCPVCRAPYNQADIPAVPTTFAQRTIERITWILSEGKKLGIRISINFSTYTFGGFLITSIFIENDGGILGLFMGAAALSLVGDVSLYTARRIIEWVNPQNPTVRKVLFVATTALAAVASIYVATLLFSAIEARIVARLAPESQAVYSYFRGKAYTAPDEVPYELWYAAVLAYNQICGVAIGSCSAFLFAFFLKNYLFANGVDLDEVVPLW